MIVACNCLNFVARISENVGWNRNAFKFNAAMSDGLAYESLEFLKSALSPVAASAVEFVVQHDALVHQQKLDKWTINRCLNCDCHVYATGDGAPAEMLISADLLRDEAQLLKMKNFDKYSMPFKIILKPIDALPPHQLSINEDVHVKELFRKLQDYIAQDSAETETEIRRLTMDMNQRRERAEKDFQRIVAIIESTSTIESTKTLSSENIESLTPPVTPESINDKMSIDDHLPQPVNMMQRTIANVFQQQPARTINFDDDIFEIDGMQEAKNETDRYHKYSDTDEGSDGERAVEKRSYNRGRSGSINIARSAPISMPQFNHHAIHAIDTDDVKAVNEQQMDIASSIKMLARSIHVDSVFGELPNRPVLRFNTEF